MPYIIPGCLGYSLVWIKGSCICFPDPYNHSGRVGGRPYHQGDYALLVLLSARGSPALQPLGAARRGLNRPPRSRRQQSVCQRRAFPCPRAGVCGLNVWHSPMFPGAVTVLRWQRPRRARSKPFLRLHAEFLLMVGLTFAYRNCTGQGLYDYCARRCRCMLDLGMLGDTVRGAAVRA